MITTLALSVVLAVPVDDPIRLMTFNIRYATAADGDNSWTNRRALVVDRIRAAAADVVGLQEVLASQFDQLKHALPEYRFIGSGREGGRKGEFSPILVHERRFTIESEGQFWLSATPTEVGSRGFDAALPRICTFVVVRARSGGVPFVVLNTHFDHRGATARLESAKLLVAGMARMDRLPRVLLGDFNAGEDSDPMQVLRKAGYRDTFRVRHPEAREVGTFHGFQGRKDGAKIDGIYVDASWTVIDAAIDTHMVDGRAPSDHWPVTAELRLEPKG